SCTGLGGGGWTEMSGTSRRSGTWCGGGTGSPQPRSSPCCRSGRPRCRPEPLGCPPPPAPGWWGPRGPPGSTNITCEGENSVDEDELYGYDLEHISIDHEADGGPRLTEERTAD